MGAILAPVFEVAVAVRDAAIGRLSQSLDGGSHQ